MSVHECTVMQNRIITARAQCAVFILTLRSSHNKRTKKNLTIIYAHILTVIYSYDMMLVILILLRLMEIPLV